MFIDNKEIDRGEVRTIYVSAENLEHFRKFTDLSDMFDKLGVKATIVGSATSVVYGLNKTLNDIDLYLLNLSDWGSVITLLTHLEEKGDVTDITRRDSNSVGWYGVSVSCKYRGVKIGISVPREINGIDFSTSKGFNEYDCEFFKLKKEQHDDDFIQVCVLNFDRHREVLRAKARLKDIETLLVIKRPDEIPL